MVVPAGPTGAPFAAVCDEVGLPAEVAARASDAVLSGAVKACMAMSGKQGSGKDTIGPLVVHRLNPRTVTHLYFADALKNECDALIAMVSSAPTPSAAAETIVSKMNVDAVDASAVVELMWDVVRRREVTARSRLPEVRALLQLWGTDVRRRQDFDWWVKPTIRDLVLTLASGHSVYFSDIRFPNEADWAARCGVVLVRLDVSVDTQVRRLRERDGVDPDPSSFLHESETALDQYPRFDIRVQNDGPVEAAVACVLRSLPR